MKRRKRLKEINKSFLDHGFVALVDMMGDDYRILQSARVSTGGAAKKGDAQDRGLIRYLYKNQHMSPFEQVCLTFHAKIPNFVMKQFLRHRTFSFNEYSQRYSPVIDDYYMPEKWRVQGETNHQGSGEEFDRISTASMNHVYSEMMDDTFELYNDMIDEGVAREMARMIIPSSVYTEFYFTVDLRNMLHMLGLRLHEHAQYEIRVFAEAMLTILKEVDGLKWTMEIFEEKVRLDWKIQELLTSKIEPGSITMGLTDMFQEPYGAKSNK
jgi:thymidylate synthase (FAD)